MKCLWRSESDHMLMLLWMMEVHCFCIKCSKFFKLIYQIHNKSVTAQTRCAISISLSNTYWECSLMNIQLSPVHMSPIWIELQPSRETDYAGTLIGPDEKCLLSFCMLYYYAVSVNNIKGIYLVKTNIKVAANGVCSVLTNWTRVSGFPVNKCISFTNTYRPRFSEFFNFIHKYKWKSFYFSTKISPLSFQVQGYIKLKVDCGNKT